MEKEINYKDLGTNLKVLVWYGWASLALTIVGIILAIAEA
jgi:hypothetical protein